LRKKNSPLKNSEGFFFDKVIAPQPETDNYITPDVDAKNLTVKCFSPNGRPIDEVTLKK